MFSIIEFIDNNCEALYYLGRLTAVFIIGPILTYKGIYYEDNLLLLIGVLLILWDGIKVSCQLCKNRRDKDNMSYPINKLFK